MEHSQTFKRFLEVVRPSPAFRSSLRGAHLELTRYLRHDESLKPHIVTTFLQGSYRRSTSIAAAHGKEGSDVDLVLVTRLDPKSHSPERVTKLLAPFLRRHYATWRPQGRSFGIDVDGVHLDLVVASAHSRIAELENENSADTLEESSSPSPAERIAWSSQPLQIPDRNSQRWEFTHPLAQLAFSRKKNALCNKHYINVVRVVKWWALHTPNMPRRPRGYPLERIVAECCPDGITSIAEGFTRTLEGIALKYSNGQKPQLHGPGMPASNVLANISSANFSAFVRASEEAAFAARHALNCDDAEESARAWSSLLGKSFPKSTASISTIQNSSELTLEQAEERGFMVALRDRRDLYVSGLDNITRLRRCIAQVVEDFEIHVELDPETPPELADYIGVLGLSAARWGLAGATAGLAVGALIKDPKPWTILGGVLGTLFGLAKGHRHIQAGFRIRMGYDADMVPWIRLKALV